MINISGYDIVRKDRSRNGGGVSAYICDTINYRNRHELIPPDLEAICLEIGKPYSRTFLAVIIAGHLMLDLISLYILNFFYNQLIMKTKDFT